MSPNSLIPSPTSLHFDRFLASVFCRAVARLLIITLLLIDIPRPLSTAAEGEGESVILGGVIRYVNATDPSCQGLSPCYAKIQTAINTAQPGDTIRVQAGEYDEALLIKQKQDLVLEADPTLPEGSVMLDSVSQRCGRGDVITVNASTNITIRGFSITDAGGQAIEIKGGSPRRHNDHIVIERNRIFGNGASKCQGGIRVGANTPDTVIVNNLLYGNGQDAIRFLGGKGGTHYVVQNVIHGNRRDGINVTKGQTVVIVNNLITKNGTDPKPPTQLYGIRRPAPKKKSRTENAQLLHNLICGNTKGELFGPMLDGFDAGNLTPTGTEDDQTGSTSVIASPQCGDMVVVYANLNGADGQPNTKDDDFTLLTDSPAVDAGIDPRLPEIDIPIFSATLEQDFFRDVARPAGAGFDVGAIEGPRAPAQCVPDTTQACYDGPPNTDGVGICRGGMRTCQTDGTYGACQGQVLPQTEICDTLDNDCDGQGDEGGVCVVNQPPRITSTAITEGSVDQPYIYDVEATDPDAGDTLVYTLTTKPNGMTIDAATGVIQWTPTASGSAEVTVQLSDGHPGGTATQSFTIQVAVVNPNNMAPRAQANSYTIRADQTLTVPAAGVLGNDSDPENDPITARKLTDPTRGALSFNANGSFSYTPGAANQTCTTPPPAPGISFTAPLGSSLPEMGFASGVYGLAKGDFNMDGFLDLAATGQPTGPNIGWRVWLLLGKGDNTFQPPLTVYSVAADVRPFALLAKDLDGDCKLDLLVSVSLARQVLFFKGKGDGAFETPVPTALTREGGSLQSGDFNGDNQLDLVSASGNHAFVQVLLGNGNGTFQAPVDYTMSTVVWDQAIGDVNGDNAPDIVVSRGTSGLSQIDVLLNKNDGSGAFNPAQQFPTNMQVAGFYLADFNSDTKLDIVAGGALCKQPNGSAATPITGCMAFIPGHGDGTFPAPTAITSMAHFATRGGGSENAAPDVNGDGILDVVFGETSNQTGNLLHIRLGNGDGTFSLSTMVASPGPVVSPQPLSAPAIDTLSVLGAATVDDFNGDGVMDIATALGGSGSSPGRLAVLSGTTPGKFASARIFPVLEPPFGGFSGFTGGNKLGSRPMTLGDFTNDGQPELAVIGDFNRLGLMPMATDGTLGPVKTVLSLGTSQPTGDRIFNADFDEDGSLDVVFIGTSGLIVAYGNGAGQFANPVFIPTPANTAFLNIVGGDFNNDGFPDVAAYTGAPVAIYLYLSTGGSRTFTQFGPASGSPLGDYLSGQIVGLVAADFDQDSVLDLVVSQGNQPANQANQQRSLYLRGNGDGTFQPAVMIANGLSGGILDYAAADVNHDEKLDLFSLRLFGGATVQLGNGNGAFAAPVDLDLGLSGVSGQLALADFDGDGHVDLAATIGTHSYGVTVLRGNGDGTFSAGQKLATGTNERNTTALLVADVNTDGRPDILAGGRSFYAQDFTVLLNDSATLGACTFSDSFTYAATDGSLDSPPTTVRITIQPVNHPPLITSAPVTAANTGQLYRYDVNATDQDAGDRLSYALVTAPSGMTIDPITGVIQWTPASTQAGPRTVKVRVYDSTGAFAEQNFTITVTQRITVPNVVGQTQANAQTTITGANLTVGTITQRYSPTISAENVISQTPAAGLSVARNTAVNLVVSLGPLVVPGLVSISVTPSNPVVLVGGTQAFIATGVLDDGSTVDVTEGVTWNSDATSVATINGFGVATGVAAGSSVITAALDTISGNTTLEVRARVTGDSTLPTAAITTPGDGAEVTSPINVVGTATDANFFRYELSYALAGETNFTLLSSGSNPVSNGVLGQFDPTLLINDLYDLKLTVFDLGGNEVSATVTVQVARELKVGLFTITFQDLQIPLSGIPITINRTYDSRDKGKGDFGIGWRLDIQTLRIRPNREQGSGWVVNHTGGGFGSFILTPVGQHKVSLTLPGGKVEEFDLRLNPSVSPLVPLQTTTASYIPRAGTLGSLVSLDDNDLIVVGDQPGDVTLTTFSGGTYNPTRFRYIAADGTMIDIDRAKGVEKVHDLNGNTLTFGANGITHSSGKSVTFTRDAQGRITQITDPAGNSQSYAYNAAGDLITHTDPAGNATRFTYNSNHYLLQITDPLNRPVSRNEYDADGRLISVTDAKGNKTTFTHDLSGRQEVTTDRLGRVSVYSYDDQGNILSTTNPLGETTTYTYDSRGNELTVTNPLGQTTTFTYDSRDNATSFTDPLGRTTTFAYNSRDQLVSTTDPLGHTSSASYDAAGNILSQTNALGQTTQVSYDGAGNPLSFTDTRGLVARNTYDAAGNRTSLIDVSGAVTTLTSDVNGKVLTQSDNSGLNWNVSYNSVNRPSRLIRGNVTSTVSYDAARQITGVTTASGQTVTFAYDASGQLSSFSGPDGTPVLSRTYDAEGNTHSAADPLGNVTTFTYDGANRLTLATSANGTTQQRTYDAAGNVVQITDALGRNTRYTYDAAGQQTSIIDALGGVTTKQYDGAGNVIRTTDPLGRISQTSYDALGRVIAVTHADGSTETQSYDAAGNVTQTTDAGGSSTSFSYNPENQLVAVTDALGNTTRYEYNALGQRTAIIDPNGNRTLLSYDAQGRLVGTIYPAGGADSRTYDMVGRLLTSTNGNGEVLQYSYDPRGQLSQLALPGGLVESYTYTADGLVSTVTDTRGVTRFEYDGTTRRLTRMTEPDGRSVRYAYDAVGNRTLMAHAMATNGPEEITQYTYDALNRMTEVTDPDGGVTRYTYDAVSNRTGIMRPNGTTTTFTYNARNRITSLTDRNSGGMTLASETYTLDARGNRTGVQRADGSRVEYSYDATSKVTAERHFNASNVLTDNIDYTYDAAGNLVARDTPLGNVMFAYNENNQLVSGGGIAYSYDGAGNLLSETDGTGAVTQYTYDARGRMVQVQPAVGAATLYTYDFRGLRQSKSGPGGTVNFLIDRQNATGFAQVVRESDNAGTTLRSYAYGADLLSQTTGGATLYYHIDALGSTRLLTNQAGVQTDTYDYSTYGTTFAQTGTSTNAYRFAGEQQDSESGLYYLRARYYQPQIGRFLSRDPATGNERDPLSLHKYQYAHGNPVNFTDPSGLSTILGTVLPILQNIATQLAVKGPQLKRAYDKTRETAGETSEAFAIVLTFLALAEAWSNPRFAYNFYGAPPAHYVGLGMVFATAVDMVYRNTNYVTSWNCGSKSAGACVAIVKENAGDYFSPPPPNREAFIFLTPRFFKNPIFPTLKSLMYNRFASMPGMIIHEYTHITWRVQDQAYSCGLAYGLTNFSSLASAFKEVGADLVDDPDSIRLMNALPGLLSTLGATTALRNPDNHRCFVESSTLGVLPELLFGKATDLLLGEP